MHDCCYRDMGAHVDGFIAVVAHTVILGVSASKKVSGKKANVMLAAHYASEAALRLLKAGNEVRSIFCNNNNIYFTIFIEYMVNKEFKTHSK